VLDVRHERPVKTPDRSGNGPHDLAFLFVLNGICAHACSSFIFS
jgi:hypothetical protein